jgi:RimJ/RimL family protein N-acetyltransferase
LCGNSVKGLGDQLDAADMNGASHCWNGELVRLRAIEPSDWETYFAWNEDVDQARALAAVPLPQSREAVKQWAEREATRLPAEDDFRFVIENRAGEVVGDLTTHHCDPRAGTFAYGITIRTEHRRKGYATEAIRLVLAFYFAERRYQKVTVSVFSFNEPSIRLHERLGFRQEGRLRRTVYTRGRHFDELLFGLTAEEFSAGDAVQADR